ncbi:MAG TPA: hypothetical protein VF529_06115 [Solirubrobacteraceae bacterium]
MGRRLTYANVLATAAFLVALGAAGGVATGALAPTSETRISACYARATGDLRIYDGRTKPCSKNENPIEWNVQGPPGSTPVSEVVVADAPARTIFTAAGLTAMASCATSSSDPTFHRPTLTLTTSEPHSAIWSERFDADFDFNPGEVRIVQTFSGFSVHYQSGAGAPVLFHAFEYGERKSGGNCVVSGFLSGGS